MGERVIHADCVAAMAELAESSVDAIVTDPPYSLGFMGKAWDTDFDHAWTPEALRVLKPGGHLLAFGGTRTYHRLACAVEDAGFEIRDSLIWLYGSGFPKSLDVSKAIDKAAGAERRERRTPKAGHENFVGRDNMKALREGTMAQEGGFKRPWMDDPEAVERAHWDYAPATPEAETWNGWGTALKPGHEPIVVARKPLVGTVAQNVLEHGTGALNIDGCRIDGPKGDGNWKGRTERKRGEDFNGFAGGWDDSREGEQNGSGRWPANVVLSPEAAEELDRQSGERPAEQRGEGVATGFGAGLPTEGGARQMGDTGGASRFFYCAKASRGERNAGLDGFEKRPIRWSSGEQNPGSLQSEGTEKAARNAHPTVKPIDLMRWLVRLVTPPGGTVLDPFLGSGTTGCAAVLEGFDFVGIEREAEYVEIAGARIAYWARQPKQLSLEAADG